MLSGDRVEQARLADAVASQHAGYFARGGREGDIAQCLRRAVMQINRVDLQHWNQRELPPQIDLDHALVL